MQRLSIKITILVLCCSLIGCASKSRIDDLEPVEEFPALVNIKKIYIGNLGNEEGAGLVGEKIRLRLAKSIRFSVVETPENADAVLTGFAGVEKRYYASDGNLQTNYAGTGIFRLVDLRTKETIWTFEYKRGFMRPGGSVSSRVADKTVNKLLKDAEYVDGKFNEPQRGSANNK